MKAAPRGFKVSLKEVRFGKADDAAREAPLMPGSICPTIPRTAWRSNITGLVKGSAPVFRRVRRG